MIQWIVVANKSSAKIFQQCQSGKVPRLIKEIINPLATHSPGELIRHQRGVSLKMLGQKGVARHYSMGKHQVTRDIIDQFARQIVNYLKTAKSENLFTWLSFVAEPRMLGSIRKNLTKILSTSMINTLPLDLAQEDTAMIRRFIAKNDELQMPIH